MPSFEFCYINADGSLACTLAACFADEAHAKKFVSATKLSDRKHYEVWLGERLVFDDSSNSPRQSPSLVNRCLSYG